MRHVPQAAISYGIAGRVVAAWERMIVWWLSKVVAKRFTAMVENIEGMADKQMMDGIIDHTKGVIISVLSKKTNKQTKLR